MAENKDIGKESISQQLSLAKELNNVLRQQSKLLTKINSQMGSQSALIKDVQKAGRGRVNALKGQSDSVKTLTKSIQDAKTASRGFTDELKQGLRDAKEDAGNLRGAFGGLKDFMFSWKGGVLAIFGGIGAAIGKLGTSIVSIFKGAFSLVQSIVKGAMGIVKATIMAPFKMMGALTDAANKIREISVVINGAVQSAKGMIGNFKEVGSTTQKAFGVALSAVKKLPGGLYSAREQGTAEMIQDAAELTKNFAAFQEELEGLSKNGARSAIALQKAFSYTAEDFKAMVIATRSSGKSLDEEMQDSLKSIDKLKTATGSTSKHAGEQFKQFYVTMKFQSQATRSQIESTAIKFTKLGMSAENAMSMVAKFDTLESGSETVAGIARNFGVFIDQNEMLMAQDDPGKMLSMYQKKFAESGVFFEDMSRARRQQLQQLTGITDPMTLAAVFGEGGEAAIEKALKKAKADKKAKDMPSLLRKINKSIKGVADSMGRLMKPFEAFMDGFTRGLAEVDGNGLMKGAHTIQETFRSMGKEMGRIFGKTGLIQEMTSTLTLFAKKLSEIMPDVAELFKVILGGEGKSGRDAMGILSDIGVKLFGAYKPIVNKGIQFIATIIEKLAPFVIKSFSVLGQLANEAMMSFLSPGYTANFGKIMGDSFKGVGANYITPETKKSLQDVADSVGNSFDKEFGMGSAKLRKTFAPDGTMKEEFGTLGSQMANNFVATFEKLGNIIGKVLKEALLSVLSDPKVMIAFALLMNPLGALKLAGQGVMALGRGAARMLGRGGSAAARGTGAVARSAPGRFGQHARFNPSTGRYHATAGSRYGRAGRMVSANQVGRLDRLRGAASQGRAAMLNRGRALGQSIANSRMGKGVATAMQATTNAAKQAGAGLRLAATTNLVTTGNAAMIAKAGSGLAKGVAIAGRAAGALGVGFTIGHGLVNFADALNEGKSMTQAGEAMGNTFLSGLSFGLIDETHTAAAKEGLYKTLMFLSGDETEDEITKRMKPVTEAMVKNIRLRNAVVDQARQEGIKAQEKHSNKDIKLLLKKDRMGLITLSDQQRSAYNKLLGLNEGVQQRVAKAQAQYEQETKNIRKGISKMEMVLNEAMNVDKDKGYVGAEDTELLHAGDMFHLQNLKSQGGKVFIDQLLRNMQRSDEIDGDEMQQARNAVHKFNRASGKDKFGAAQNLKKVMVSILDGHINDNGKVEFDDSDEMPIFFEAVQAAINAQNTRLQKHVDNFPKILAAASKMDMSGLNLSDLREAARVLPTDKAEAFAKEYKKRMIEDETKAVEKLVAIAFRKGDDKLMMQALGMTVDEVVKAGIYKEDNAGAWFEFGDYSKNAAELRIGKFADPFKDGIPANALTAKKILAAKKDEIADAAAKAAQLEKKAFEIFAKDVQQIYDDNGLGSNPHSVDSFGLRQAYDRLLAGDMGALVGIVPASHATQVADAATDAVRKATAQQKDKSSKKAEKAAKKGATASAKKGKSKVKAKPLKGTKDLAKLDQKTLRLLSNKWSVKNIRIRGGKITEMLDKLGPAAEKVAGALQGKAGPAMSDISVKSAEATANLALTVIELDKVHDRMAAVAASLSGMVTSITRIKSESNGFLGKDKIQITGEDGTSLTVNLNVTMDAKTLATGLEKTGMLRFA